MNPNVLVFTFTFAEITYIYIALHYFRETEALPRTAI